jgi:hypothetical protein
MWSNFGNPRSSVHAFIFDAANAHADCNGMMANVSSIYDVATEGSNVLKGEA